jgi:hypothetical protein
MSLMAPIPKWRESLLVWRRVSRFSPPLQALCRLFESLRRLSFHSCQDRMVKPTTIFEWSKWRTDRNSWSVGYQRRPIVFSREKHLLPAPVAPRAASGRWSPYWPREAHAALPGYPSLRVRGCIHREPRASADRHSTSSPSTEYLSRTPFEPRTITGVRSQLGHVSQSPEHRLSQ